MAILEDPVTVWMAFACTWVSNIISVYLIVQHIRNYTQPGFQRYICRIVFIVPFYCTASWLALHHRESSIYFETPRDCYEAWVIYNFMSLCMAYVGGPGAVVVKSEGKLIKPSWILCTCCMKPIPVDGFFLRNCKQGTLQFVIAKPILALLTLILFWMGLYQVGNWSVTDGYLYEAIIYNFCYSLALFWMLLFYVGTEELLKPYKPLMKFFVFKTVIFLTFWQGLVVTFFATRFGWSPEDSEAMQNWLICIEMFFAAVGMMFAFPYDEYNLGGSSAPGFKWEAFKHAISISDALEDIIFQFNPSYKAYVLHTDGGPSENVKRKKFRGKKKKRPAFTVIQNELGALGDKITKMSKLKLADRRRLTGISGDADGGDIEEGGAWQTAARKQNLLTNLQGGLQSLAEKPQAALVSWLPGITELERRQAELLDSDSDAGYDEENQQDNQLDDDVLTSSSEEEAGRSPRHKHGPSHRGGARGGRLATRGSSSGGEEDGLVRRDLVAGTSDSDTAGEGGAAGGYSRRSGGARGGQGPHADWAQFPSGSGSMSTGKHRRRGSAATPQQDDSWAQFPGPGQQAAAAASAAQNDSSWADFGAMAAPAVADMDGHAAAGAGAGAAGSDPLGAAPTPADDDDPVVAEGAMGATAPGPAAATEHVALEIAASAAEVVAAADGDSAAEAAAEATVLDTADEADSHAAPVAQSVEAVEAEEDGSAEAAVPSELEVVAAGSAAASRPASGDGKAGQAPADQASEEQEQQGEVASEDGPVQDTGDAQVHGKSSTAVEEEEEEAGEEDRGGPASVEQEPHVGENGQHMHATDHDRNKE